MQRIASWNAQILKMTPINIWTIKNGNVLEFGVDIGNVYIYLRILLV